MENVFPGSQIYSDKNLYRSEQKNNRLDIGSILSGLSEQLSSNKCTIEIITPGYNKVNIINDK